MNFDALKIVKDGISLSLTTTSSSATQIPTPSGGSILKYVRVSATAATFISFGGSGMASVTTNAQMLAANYPEQFDVTGTGGYFRAATLTGTGTIQVSPVES